MKHQLDPAFGEGIARVRLGQLCSSGVELFAGFTLMDAVSAVGTIAGFAGQLAGGQQQSRAAEAAAQAQAQAAQYNQQVAQMNANIERQNADRAAQTAAQNTKMAQTKAAAAVSAVKAAQSASGLDVGIGSAQDVVESERTYQGENIKATQASGSQQAYGFAQRASNYDAQANLAAMQAQQAMNSGAIASQTALTSSMVGAGTQFATYLGSKGVGGSADPFTGSYTYADKSLSKSNPFA